MTDRPQPSPETPREKNWSEFRIMRCKKCGCFIGNGGWIPFGNCKKCGEQW